MGKKETLYKNGVVPTTENIKPRPLTSDELIFAKHEKAIYQPTDDLKKESGVVSSAFGNTDFGESKFDDPNMKSEAILDGQYQDIRGELQSRTDKLFNAVPRLLSKVGTEVAKTPGYLYALGEAGLTDKTLAESLDNAWLNGLEHADQAVKDEFAIYKPKSVREGNLWDNLTSASFWTDEGVDGMGFLAAMVFPGAALKATGIAGKLAGLPRLQKVLGTTQKALKGNIELGQATLLNTALEAAAETKGLGDDLKKQFSIKIDNGEINPNTGRPWTEEDAKAAIGNACVDEFQQNLALLIVPNMIMNKNLLGRFNGSKKVLDEFKDATGRLVTTNPIVKKSLIKEYAKGLGTAMASEGLMEEGGQTTFENYNKKVAFGDNTANLASEYVNTLTTTEGQKSIVLGAVLGGLSSIRGTKQELKAEDKQRKTLSNLIKDNFEGFSKSMNNIVERDDQGNIILDDKTNERKINIKEAADVITNLVKEQQSTNLQDLAALNNDKDGYDFIFNQQLARFAKPYLNVEGGLEVLEQHIDDLSNRFSKDNTDKIEETKFKFDTKQALKNLKDSNESIQQSIDELPLEDLHPNKLLVGAFANKLSSTAFQETAKQLFLNKRIEELKAEDLRIKANAANNVSQFNVDLRRNNQRLENLVKSLELSKANYESIFNEEQIKEAFKDFIKDNEVQNETINNAVESQSTVNSTVPPDNTVATPTTNNTNTSNTDNLPTPSDLGFEPYYEDDEDSATPVETLTPKPVEAPKTKAEKIADIEAQIKAATELGTIDNPVGGVNNDISGAPNKTWREHYQSLIDTLNESTVTQEPTTVDTTNVSESLITNTGDNTFGEEQITEAPKEVSKGFFSDIEKGLASMANVVMMKLFHNDFVNGRFTFERDANGTPEVNTNSNVDIEALNKVQVGDTVEFELVTLEGKALEDYNKSKEESIKHINHNITNMGNLYSYGTNDKNYGFDDKHIAIKSNGKIIGYVQQPHAISNEIKPESKQSYIDARNTILETRKAILDGLSKGKVSTRITEKGSGNLYTKLDSNGKIDLINDLFSTPRKQDVAKGGNLIFAYNDGKGLKLPKMDDISLESEVTTRLSELGNWGKSGSVYQLVKDTSGKWYPIPVYASLIEDNSIKGILKALKGLTDTSTSTDVINALNPFIYASFEASKNAPIKVINKEGTKLVIDGIEHSIDNLNKGIGLSDFKESLKTKRQNIEILNINSKYTQQSIKERKTLSSNATTFKGEYLVQPFLLYAPLIRSNEVEEYQEAPTVALDNILNADEGESLLDRMIRSKGGDTEDPGFSRNEFGDLAANRTEFKTWLDKNLPGLTLSDVTDLKALKTNLNDALGAYRNMVVYLFKDATNKTAYHEAFHGVFRNMLNNEQKFALIEEAINKYEAPSQADLDFIQEGLKSKATPEQLTYVYYEEKMADDFAEFTNTVNTLDLKASEVKSTWTKIKDFFVRIFKHFDMFTSNNQSNIEKLFDNINTGKFATKSTVAKKNNIQLINKELNGDYFGSLAFARHEKFKATFKADRTKSIGDSFMNMYNTLKAQGEPNISPNNIFKFIYNKYAELAKNEKALSKMSDVELNNLKNILNNFDFLRKESIKYLEMYGLKVSDGDINYEETDLNEDNIADEEVNQLASQTTKGLGDWVTQAGLKSASVRIKMFVSSIPVIENGVAKTDAYGFPMFHDFNKLYYFLERSLTGINTFEEMIEEMQTLSSLRPELLQVIDKLTKPSTFTNAEELTKLQNDFKSNFNKQQLTYTLIKFDTNSNTGDVTYRIFDANRLSVANEIATQWKDNLNNPARNTIAKHIEGEASVNGSELAIKHKEQFLTTSKGILTGVLDYNSANNFLTKLGIEFSPDVLQTLLDKKSPKLVLSVNELLHYYANPNPTPKETQDYDKAMKALVKLETSGRLNTYTQSFNNVENSNIYTIQLPSFASKLMDDLTGTIDKFDSRLGSLQKDPLYKHSNLLEALKADNNFRTTQFRLSYLDGLKDEKGTKDGSKFTNMSPKDFMSMQVALFQNISANQNKVASGKVGKYIYITPSDKSMTMIYDGKVYNSTLTNDEITLNTPIVNNFYNVFLQEAARIKQQLEIKAKVQSGELDSNVLLEHYHYKAKGKPTDFDGFAYQFMHFGEGFNTKFNQIVIDNLYNSSDLEESLSKIEVLIKKEIVEKLKKDYHATLNEAVNKGVIAETKDGYSNISLDVKSGTDIKQNIADFALNTWLNNIEMSNLLNGDIALYKAKDLQKRTYQSGAMGVNINTTSHPIAKTKVVKDYTSKSDLEYLREFAGDIVDDYGKNNVTDAQVLVSPEFYKAIHEGRGTWSDAMQIAYDIAEGVITNPTAEQLKQARLQLSNIKPFYFGNRFDETLGIQRYEQVKCAMLPLFKSYNKNNPLMTAKRAEMDKQGLDMIAFESSFKAAIGSRESIDSDKGLVLDLDMNNFMVQVDNPAHILDEENDSIRQIKMLMLGNINPDINYSGKSGQELINEINDIEGFNIQESLKDLNKLINGDKTGKFKEYLKEMLTKRNATDNIMEGLNIVDGEFEYALDGGPTSTAMENLISSLFTNKVIKQAFEGGSGVQASAIGMKYKGGNTELDKLQSDLKYFKSEDGKTFWSEAIMPAWSKEFFNADGTHKDNIPDNLKELLFYRIPTEGFHSMMPIKVKSFLPVEYGNTILMPYEVTTQFGADFDFDKIYFFSPAFNKNDKGELEKIKYDESKSIEENSKHARNNKVLDNYLKVLTSKEILPLILNPSGFEELAKIKADIDRKDNIKSNQGSFFSSVTQRDYKARNHVGMGLKGQLALHVSGHSYATLLDLAIKGEGITFNGNNTISLSQLYNANGKLISKEVSSLMAAILDDIKNPIIQALGINEFTADTWATIVRAGFDTKTAVNFVTQPVIVELSKKLDENKYKIKSKNSKYNSGDTLLLDYNNRLKSIYELLSEDKQQEIDKLTDDSIDLTDTDLEFYRNWKAINVNKLNPNEGRTQEAKDLHNFELAKYYTFQNKVLSNYNNYDRIAKDLVKINRLFGVNKEAGPNFEDIVNKKYLMAEIEAEGFSISGLTQETLNNIKPLKASYDTQVSTLDYLSKYFPYDSDVYKQVKFAVIDALYKDNGQEESLSKLPVKNRMLINNFIRTFIDYNSDLFAPVNSQEVKQELFKEIPSLLNRIKDNNNDKDYFNGALRKNIFIDNLKVRYDEKAKMSFIELKANRLDLQVKNNISEAIEGLYRNEPTKPLVIALIKYSFAASGLGRGFKSFHDLFPPVVLKDLGYADFRKSTTTSLNLGNYSMSDEQINRLVDQMVRNFPNEFTKAFDTTMFKKSGDKLITTQVLAQNAGRAKEVIINYDNVIGKQEFPIFVKYLRVYDNIAKKSILYKHDNAGIYKPINKLGKAGSMIEINTLEDIDKSINVDNNLDNKQISNTFADETNTNVLPEAPVLESGEYQGESQSFEDSLGSSEKPVDTNEEAENSKPINNELPDDTEPCTGIGSL